MYTLPSTINIYTSTPNPYGSLREPLTLGVDVGCVVYLNLCMFERGVVKRLRRGVDSKTFVLYADMAYGVLGPTTLDNSGCKSSHSA